MSDLDKPQTEPVQAVRDMSALLDTDYTPKLVGPRRTADEILTIPWVYYDRRIRDGVHAAMDLLGIDLDYQDHIDAVREQEVSEASAADLRTWFTFMSRGERFCDGFLSSHIEDVSLNALTKRLEQLINAGKLPADAGS